MVFADTIVGMLGSDTGSDTGTGTVSTVAGTADVLTGSAAAVVVFDPPPPTRMLLTVSVSLSTTVTIVPLILSDILRVLLNATASAYAFLIAALTYTYYILEKERKK